MRPVQTTFTVSTKLIKKQTSPIKIPRKQLFFFTLLDVLLSALCLLEPPLFLTKFVFPIFYKVYPATPASLRGLCQVLAVSLACTPPLVSPIAYLAILIMSICYEPRKNKEKYLFEKYSTSVAATKAKSSLSKQNL